MYEIVQFRRNTDTLDEAIISYLVNGDGAPVSHIAREVQRPYPTVSLRCFKLEAAGILRSEWYNHMRLFSVAQGDQR